MRDFGRGSIQDWTVAQITRGRCGYAEAASLTLATVPLPEGIAPSQCLDSVAQLFLTQIEAHTITGVVAVDITSWNVVLVEPQQPTVGPGNRDQISYQVLHVSTAKEVIETVSR